MPARLTGKRTETRHALREIEQQAAALAKAKPQGWEQVAAHLRALHTLLHAASDLRFRAEKQEKDVAWTLHGVVAEQYHSQYARLMAPLHAANAILARGERMALKTVVDFLEADPYFDQSGYLKQQMLPRVCRLSPFDESVAARLRQVVLNRVQSFWGREFPYYKRLAFAVDNPGLRDALTQLAQRSEEAATQARAASVLKYLMLSSKVPFESTARES